MWPVVDPQPVGVQLVHQVAGLAGVEPLGDHRLVADRQADEHVEVLGALAARGGRQKPAVRGRAEANLGERLMSLGRRVGVAQRLVGDQQVPADCLQVGRVAVQRAVAAQHHAGPVAQLAVEHAQLTGDLALVVEHQELDVRRQRRQSATGRSLSELVAPLPKQPALGDHHGAEPPGR